MDVTSGERRRARKKRFKEKFERMLSEHKSILICGIDNVGSLQMQKIRIALRGKAVPVMGKNTLMRKFIRDKLAQLPQYEPLLEYIRGNVGLVFTNDDVAGVRKSVLEFKVPAAAKSGTIAPSEVTIPAGPTGLDPGQTNFFQALNIPTKIVKLSIEIINEVTICKKGEKVTSSTVALLSKLDIKPFFYGVVVKTVFEEGMIYPADVLDVGTDELLKRFLAGVSKLTAISMAANYPSLLTLPFTFANAWRKILAVSLAVDYKFTQKDEFLKAGASGPAPSAEKDKGGKDKGAKDKGGKDKGGKPPATETTAPPVAEPEPEPAEVGLGDLFG